MTDQTTQKSTGRLLLEILIVLSPLPIMKTLAGAGVLDSMGLETVSRFAGPIGTFMVLMASTIALKRSGLSWADMGLRRPKRLWTIPVFAVGTLLFAYFLAGGVGYVLTNNFGVEPPDISTFDYIQGNLPALMLWLMISWVIGGFSEELSFRGFLLNHLAQAFGGAKMAFVLAAFVQAAVFGAAHAYQGVGGMFVTGSVGLAMGIFYLLGKRNLWPVIIAHGLMDTIGFIAIYSGAQI